MRKNMLRSVSSTYGLRDTQAWTAEADGNLSLDISGVDIQTGDVGILVIASTGADVNYSISGWTELEVADNRLRMFTRDMVSTDSSISTTGADLVDPLVVLTIWAGVVLPDGTDSTVSDQSTTWNNPVSADSYPSYMVAAYFAEARNTSYTITGFPTGFDGIWNINRTQDESGSNSLAVVQKEITETETGTDFNINPSSPSPDSHAVITVTLDKD